MIIPHPAFLKIVLLFLPTIVLTEEKERFVSLDEGQILHFPSAFNAR